ncbi:hypothetical protein IY888_04480, partial [Campylobacter volucris]|nr:hypothetical protein [Campylobacter volucris]
MFISSNINPYQNFANSSFAKLENLEPKKDTANNVAQNDFTKSKENFDNDYKITYASEFGFRIDEKGFFEKDLNKSAKIPLDYDINIKSI